MAENMVREIEEGIGESGVRCGVIGEIGCSYPLAHRDSERSEAPTRGSVAVVESRMVST